MRRRVTMRRRNSYIILVVICLGLTPYFAAQSGTEPQVQPPAATTGPGTNSTPTQAPPTPDPQAQVPSPQTPAEGTAGSAGEQPTTQGTGPGQATPPGQTPDSDAGVFVFRKEVDEVVLHATVFDDK